MAFLFRPFAVKRIPDGAQRLRIKGTDYVQWPRRGGGMVRAEALPGGKCKVVSPVWWVEYRDANGVRKREGISRDRRAAEHRMAQIIQDVERQRGGLRPAADLPTGETLTSLAAEYEKHLLALGRSAQHCSDTRRRIVTVLADCRWATAADVTPARWVRWVGESRAGTETSAGFSAETVNHYLRSLRQFFRWMVDFKGLAFDPLASCKLLNAEADRRIQRRTLAADDFRSFIDTTRASSKRRVHLDGPSRAALYLLAARTGLRSGVMARLTPENVAIDADPPHVVVPAGWMKSRKPFVVPIPKATVDELRPWLVSRPAGRRLWPGHWHAHGHASSMVARDLMAAGIPYMVGGLQYDFHALRSQYITGLALAGVPLQTAQKLAGHSTPALTAKFYTLLELQDLAAAADRLGSGLGSQTPAEPKRVGRKGRGSGGAGT